MSNELGLDLIDSLTGGRIGQFDIPCPLCSPYRKAKNHRLKVLRVWRVDENFAGYSCIHCGEHGYIRDNNAAPPDPEKLNRIRAEAAKRDRAATAERLGKARWLLTQSKPSPRTLVETYLREARGYQGPLPATLRYLAPRGEYGPCMIAAFGLASEPEPGVLSIASDAVMGVQITKLAPDGGGKLGTEQDKITVGRCRGVPIALAPPNDLLALVIAEGVEDALSSHQANGWGTWAAGGCRRMPFLAQAIPTYIESVSIVADVDPDGDLSARELADLVDRRGMEVRLIGGAA
jgi:hypothetical protein